MKIAVFWVVTQYLIFTLKMEAAWSVGSLVSHHINALCQYPEDHDLNLHRCKNKSGNSQNNIIINDEFY
jgi:hypothetical protein